MYILIRAYRDPKEYMHDRAQDRVDMVPFDLNTSNQSAFLECVENILIL